MDLDQNKPSAPKWLGLEAIVIDLDGDGPFCMTLTEPSTAVQYDLDIKVLVLNNSELGMVTLWQDLFYEKRSPTRRPQLCCTCTIYGLLGLAVYVAC
ncbi:hypothetical protein F5884DRAFT_811536 [Xylogone sp. PMI_703]|nr:hypothetical protein F5884DRAFT_811536 [Xylogone sp. PMI_703]